MLRLRQDQDNDNDNDNDNNTRKHKHKHKGEAHCKRQDHCKTRHETRPSHDKGKSRQDEENNNYRDKKTQSKIERKTSVTCLVVFASPLSNQGRLDKIPINSIALTSQYTNSYIPLQLILLLRCKFHSNARESPSIVHHSNPAFHSTTGEHLSTICTFFCGNGTLIIGGDMLLLITTITSTSSMVYSLGLMVFFRTYGTYRV